MEQRVSAAPKAKGTSFVPQGNRPLFSQPYKPRLMFMGHDESMPCIRSLAEEMRPRSILSSYVAPGTHPLPWSTIEHALGHAEMLFLGLSSSSCDLKGDAGKLELQALQMACAPRGGIPVAFVIGAHTGLQSPLVHSFGEFARLVVTENEDASGALLDVFPRAVHYSRTSTDNAPMWKCIEAFAKPRMTV